MNGQVADYDHIRALELELGFRKPDADEQDTRHVALRGLDAQIAQVEELLVLLREKRLLLVEDLGGADGVGT